ncbi:hypothetical protein ACFSOZ_34825 [Mesorhizobium newzealandense]|uniref:AraC family transcriptional regulator n=1 Tax=Mesorhizobium newzealandense TaxID=1300302 RepID=A0ABW4UMM4_9HYPH
MEAVRTHHAVAPLLEHRIEPGTMLADRPFRWSLDTYDDLPRDGRCVRAMWF